VPKRLEGERGTFSSMCVRGSTGVRVSRLLCSGASPFAGIARREWRPTGSFGAVVQPRIALPLHCLLPFAFDVVSCHVCIVPSLPMEPPPPSHDEMLRASGGTVRLLPATRGRGGLMRMRMRSSILDQ